MAGTGVRAGEGSAARFTEDLLKKNQQLWEEAMSAAGLTVPNARAAASTYVPPRTVPAAPESGGASARTLSASSRRVVPVAGVARTPLPKTPVTATRGVVSAEVVAAKNPMLAATSTSGRTPGSLRQLPAGGGGGAAINPMLAAATSARILSTGATPSAGGDDGLKGEGGERTAEAPPARTVYTRTPGATGAKVGGFTNPLRGAVSGGGAVRRRSSFSGLSKQEKAAITNPLNAAAVAAPATSASRRESVMPLPGAAIGDVAAAATIVMPVASGGAGAAEASSATNPLHLAATTVGASTDSGVRSGVAAASVRLLNPVKAIAGRRGSRTTDDLKPLLKRVTPVTNPINLALLAPLVSPHPRGVAATVATYAAGGAGSPPLVDARRTAAAVVTAPTLPRPGSASTLAAAGYIRPSSAGGDKPEATPRSAGGAGRPPMLALVVDASTEGDAPPSTAHSSRSGSDDFDGTRRSFGARSSRSARSSLNAAAAAVRTEEERSAARAVSGRFVPSAAALVAPTSPREEPAVIAGAGVRAVSPPVPPGVLAKGMSGRHLVDAAATMTGSIPGGATSPRGAVAAAFATPTSPRGLPPPAAPGPLARGASASSLRNAGVIATAAPAPA